MDSSFSCGVITYEVQYVSGPYPGSTSSFDIFDNGYSSVDEGDKVCIERTTVLTDQDWIGTTILEVTGTNPLGGLSAKSDPFTMTIVNPCPNSVVDQDKQASFGNIEVPVGESLQTVTENGPTDSVSVEYPIIPRNCLNMAYALTDPTTGAAFTSSNLGMSITYNSLTTDDVKFSLTSLKVGTLVTKKVRLTVNLVAYPTSTPATFDFEIGYRECLPTSFESPIISDKNITATLTPPFEVNVTFD